MSRPHQVTQVGEGYSGTTRGIGKNTPGGCRTRLLQVSGSVHKSRRQAFTSLRMAELLISPTDSHSCLSQLDDTDVVYREEQEDQFLFRMTSGGHSTASQQRLSALPNGARKLRSYFGVSGIACWRGLQASSQHIAQSQQRGSRAVGACASPART